MSRASSARPFFLITNLAAGERHCFHSTPFEGPSGPDITMNDLTSFTLFGAQRAGEAIMAEELAGAAKNGYSREDLYGHERPFGDADAMRGFVDFDDLP